MARVWLPRKEQVQHRLACDARSAACRSYLLGLRARVPASWPGHPAAQSSRRRGWPGRPAGLRCLRCSAAAFRRPCARRAHRRGRCWRRYDVSADRQRRSRWPFAVGIPLGRIGITLRVEVEHLVEGPESSVVKEHLARRCITQRRCLEHAAQIRLLRQVLARGTAEPEVEILRLSRFAAMSGLRGTPMATWPKSVNCAGLPPGTRSVQMALGAIASLGIVEGPVAPQLLHR